MQSKQSSLRILKLSWLRCTVTPESRSVTHDFQPCSFIDRYALHLDAVIVTAATW